MLKNILQANDFLPGCHFLLQLLVFLGYRYGPIWEGVCVTGQVPDTMLNLQRVLRLARTFLPGAAAEFS